MVHEFHSFSMQHVAMLLLLAIIAAGLMLKSRSSTHFQKLNTVIIIAGLTLSFEIIETIVLLFLGRYDYLTDLPLFLCDLSAIMLPFVLFRQNRKWIGILYFWTMAGTLQALITPDLKAGFPSFEFFRYFAMHGGIVIAILYTVVVFRIRIQWKDLIRAVLYAQVYLVCIHIINLVLRSNYGYTLQKPPGPTMLDYFGPWPWYILCGEGLMIILFLLLLLPFLRFNTSTQKQAETFEEV